MTEELFDDIYNNEAYRRLKSQEKRVYDLLSQAVGLKESFAQLEKEYRDSLLGIAQEVGRTEVSFKIYPNLAEEMLLIHADRQGELMEKIKNLRHQVRLNKSRYNLGEYEKDEFARRREALMEKLKDRLAERAWLEDIHGLLRRIRNRSEKVLISRPQSPQKEPVSPPEEENEGLVGGTHEITEPTPNESSCNPGEEEEEVGAIDTSITGEEEPADEVFDGDQTAVIPLELVGGDPDRLLEPALLVQSEQGWERYPLRHGEISIGNIRNPENDIALYDTQVSRRHVKVIFDNVTESWYFVDTNSTNGSSVNGKNIEPHHPLKLSDKDTVTLGDTKIIVYLP